MISGDEEGSIGVWDIILRKKISEFYECHEKRVNKVMFSPFNEVFMMSLSDDCKIQFYDIRE